MATTKKKVFFVCILCFFLVIAGVCNDSFLEKQIAAKETPSKKNSVVSMFSWHFELTDPAKADEYANVLKDLSVTRVYQNVSEKVMKDSIIRYEIYKLAACGIETVALTGDKSWVEDGLDEYKSIVDSIDSYNQSVEKKYRIKRIALDVEAHGLPEWKTDKKAVFRKYLSRMTEAKEYANERGLKVVQVIPTYYDNVSKTLFKRFLSYCCDEVSVMNYDKKQAERAISYEVSACAKMKIPIETIYETMPVSSKYGVTKNTTYYYEGMKALKKNVSSLRKVYGAQLGIAYHQFTTVYKLMEKEQIGEVILPAEAEQSAYPGILLLFGDDGSMFEATPYWPKGRQSSEGYRFLLNGARKNITYRVEHYQMTGPIVLTEQGRFNHEDGSRLVMSLEDV